MSSIWFKVLRSRWFFVYFCSVISKLSIVERLTSIAFLFQLLMNPSCIFYWFSVSSSFLIIRLMRAVLPKLLSL